MHSLEAIVLKEMFNEVEDITMDESMDMVMDTLIGEEELDMPMDDEE